MINIKQFSFNAPNVEIKKDLIGPLKELLFQYNINIVEIGMDDVKYGYAIRNKAVNIAFFPVKLEHELAHIVLINNFDKLLIDNWGMPSATNDNKKSTLLIKKWLLCMEARVWGVESFITNKHRAPNNFFIVGAIDNNKSYTQVRHSKEYEEFHTKVEEIMFRYELDMTNNKFLDMLQIRLDFIKDKINNGLVDSQKFDLF